jgi:hypothetical protein
MNKRRLLCERVVVERWTLTKATDEPAEAYADWRQEPRRPTRNPWPL